MLVWIDSILTPQGGSNPPLESCESARMGHETSEHEPGGPRAKKGWPPLLYTARQETAVFMSELGDTMNAELVETPKSRSFKASTVAVHRYRYGEYLHLSCVLALFCRLSGELSETL